MVGSSVKRQHLGRSLDGRKDLLVGLGKRQHWEGGGVTGIGQHWRVGVRKRQFCGKAPQLGYKTEENRIWKGIRF